MAFSISMLVKIQKTMYTAYIHRHKYMLQIGEESKNRIVGNMRIKRKHVDTPEEELRSSLGQTLN